MRPHRQIALRVRRSDTDRTRGPGRSSFGRGNCTEPASSKRYPRASSVVDDIPDEMILLETQDSQAAPCHHGHGGQAVVTGADDDDVVVGHSQDRSRDECVGASSGTFERYRSGRISTTFGPVPARSRSARCPFRSRGSGDMDHRSVETGGPVHGGDPLAALDGVLRRS